MGVFAKDWRRKMETNENEVAEMSTEECKRDVCDMIMSIDNDRLVFYLYGFIKSTIKAWE